MSEWKIVKALLIYTVIVGGLIWAGYAVYQDKYGPGSAHHALEKQKAFNARIRAENDLLDQIRLERALGLRK